MVNYLLGSLLRGTTLWETSSYRGESREQPRDETKLLRYTLKYSPREVFEFFFFCHFYPQSFISFCTADLLVRSIVVWEIKREIWKLFTENQRMFYSWMSGCFISDLEKSREKHAGFIFSTNVQSSPIEKQYEPMEFLSRRVPDTFWNWASIKFIRSRADKDGKISRVVNQSFVGIRAKEKENERKSRQREIVGSIFLPVGSGLQPGIRKKKIKKNKKKENFAGNFRVSLLSRPFSLFLLSSLSLSLSFF